MSQITLSEEHAGLAQKFFEEGRQEKFVTSYLSENGFDEVASAAIHNRYKHLCYEKRKKIGLLLVGAGAFLCVVGFMLTLLLSQNHGSFNFALYGMTSAGAMSLFGGLACIIG